MGARPQSHLTDPNWAFVLLSTIMTDHRTDHEPGPADSANRGLVFNVMRFSVYDGPGIRTTVFLKGCPLKCVWCHNPESQSPYPEIAYFGERCLRCGDCVRACPNHALRLEGDVHADTALCRQCGTCVDTCIARAREMAGRWMRVDEVLAKIERDRVFYEESAGGVTLSGGEPLQQARFAEEVLGACRARGVHTVLDTCGYAARSAFERVAEHVDLFLFDLKIIDRDQHRAFTGVTNDVILDNLRWLAEQKSEVVVRVPIIPGCTDSESNLAAISALARSLGLTRVDLLPYHRIARDKYKRLHREYPLDEVVPPPTARMQAIATEFARQGLGVRIGG